MKMTDEIIKRLEALEERIKSLEKNDNEFIKNFNTEMIINPFRARILIVGKKEVGKTYLMHNLHKALKRARIVDDADVSYPDDTRSLIEKQEELNDIIGDYGIGCIVTVRYIKTPVLLDIKNKFNYVFIFNDYVFDKNNEKFTILYDEFASKVFNSKEFFIDVLITLDKYTCLVLNLNTNNFFKYKAVN